MSNVYWFQRTLKINFNIYVWLGEVAQSFWSQQTLIFKVKVFCDENQPHWQCKFLQVSFTNDSRVSHFEKDEKNLCEVFEKKN